MAPITTLRPEEDRMCRAIAVYLQNFLNAQWGELDPPSTLNADSTYPVVRGIRDHMTDLNTVGDFPLLLCYRRGSSREELYSSETVVQYLLPSTSGPDIGLTQSILRWVEVVIVKSLTQARAALDEICDLVSGLSSVTSRYTFLSALQGGFYPSVEITFVAKEIGV